jgi:hypothetical protein
MSGVNRIHAPPIVPPLYGHSADGALSAARWQSAPHGRFDGVVYAAPCHVAADLCN